MQEQLALHRILGSLNDAFDSELVVNRACCLTEFVLSHHSQGRVEVTDNAVSTDSLQNYLLRRDPVKSGSLEKGDAGKV